MSSLGRSLLPEARSATGDLLSITKALLTWERGRYRRYRWPEGHRPVDLAPQMPLAGRTLTRFDSNYAFDLGGAKRARTADLLHAMNHRHFRRRCHTLRQLRKH
jgi:hypothetical protein